MDGSSSNESIWRFCLSALAVWRLSHLLAEEDGPWDVIVRLRARLGSSMLGRMMDCFYCLSMWVSLPLAIWASDGWMGLILQWPALSGAACLLERMTRVPDKNDVGGADKFLKMEVIEGD
jgi:hypothetical protein